MTVENTKNKMSPLQMGTTNEYPFNFAVLLQDPTAEEALEAIKASVLQADGTEIELVYNTDYTVTLNTDRIGGTLTVNDIRTSGDYITIYRQYAQTQEVDYKDFNSAPAETFEQCFDKLTMLSQQQQEEINRSIKLPVSSDITNLSLPNPVAGRTLKWNESETGLINSDVSIDEIDEFVKSANESAEIAVEKAEEIQGKLDEALEVADTIKDIEIIATLEIGDIGIAPLGIDETKGKRRYLNGQLIIQEQYVQFTNKVKSAIELYPNLACTESEWQATATMTVGGQVGKFVVDNDAGTIRLPKIIMPIQGLTDLSKLAEIVKAGLPNITGSFVLGDGTNAGAIVTSPTGAFGSEAMAWGYSGRAGNATNTFKGIFDASHSSSIYGNSNTVQQEQIQYPYFIQVATGAETEDNIINEIELNNPFSLLDYKYSEYELNNLSWLRSNGQWNSKAVYPAVYELLLKIYNGTETKAGVSVKLHTDTSATDYDFRINTAEETFRLPVKVKQVGGGTVSIYANPSALATDSISFVTTDGKHVTLYNAKNDNSNASCVQALDYRANPITYTPVGSTIQGFNYIPPNNLLANLSSANNTGLYLYFYVGETVQNANLINAGRIEEKLADLIPNNSNLITNYCTPDYENGIALSFTASGLTYTIPDNGYLSIQMLLKFSGAVTGYVKVNGITALSGTSGSTSYFGQLDGQIVVRKGDLITATGNYDIENSRAYFYPMKGAN